MKNVLTIKVAGLAVVLLAGISPPIQASMPVIDSSNLAQNIVSAVQQVAAVEKQIQQYQTQLQQYQNMLQNTVAPATYIWDQASQVMNKLMAAQDTLSYYKKQVGGIDSYLSRYQDVGYYRTLPCFTAAGCPSSQLQVIQDAQANNAEAVKRANDALLKSLDQQQQTLTSDAATLQKLQSQAMSAQGQMQALQAGHQLASVQINQLLQIRGMLAAQATAAATSASNDADKAALTAAAAEAFRSGSFTKSVVRKW
ncbi:conjugal transfer protein TrbJ [Xylella taiwanensis]|uniref:Conjugal transfer protein TrbJ n=1 Tax=Xylella taiwanensis TaxID=1444770 RepID=Z9JLB4_9GAMM|nr:conjugal transfer protein TrbJ [Xylella taiwanensis]